MQIIFWVSVAGVFFVYAGYGLLMTLINKIFPAKALPHDLQHLPELAILIAAYNEEDVITEKLSNTLALQYPKEKLHVYVISDGSNDATNKLVSDFPEVKLLWHQNRQGKTSAINRAMRFVSEPVTVFTDANVMLNAEALLEMVKHYADADTGGVSGEKRVMQLGNSAAATEGVYWKYESFLKKQDATFSSLIGAAGELFSIRTLLFSPLPEDTLLDDFMISMNVIRKGYRIAYEPKAFAMETPSLNITEEYKRKVRISAGGLQSALRLTDFINPFQYGLLSLQYIVHRLSRWLLTPLLIVLAFISNIFIADQSPTYTVLMTLQILFHISALLGFLFESKGMRIRTFYLPFYFNFMHYCIIAGWIKFLSGRQQATWQKATRLAST